MAWAVMVVFVLLCCTAPDPIVSTQTFLATRLDFFSRRSKPHFIYTNFFSQLDWPGFYLHKLFWPLLCTRCYLDKLLLATPAPSIVSQTFARNSCTPDCIYTNFCSQLLYPRFYLHKLFLATALHLILTIQTFSRKLHYP